MKTRVLVENCKVGVYLLCVYMCTRNYTPNRSSRLFDIILLPFYTLAASDFVEINDLPVTFEVNDTEKRVTIDTIGDSLVEGTEDFTLEITPVSNRIIITEETVVIRIEETTNGKNYLNGSIFYNDTNVLDLQLLWSFSQCHTL